MCKISIIIPVYNVEKYISNCIQSVMSQTYKGVLECILVDDCGTDDSITIANDILSKYCGSIIFQVLHHRYNRGLSAARNTGMEAATGDYIFFLDSDDEISPNCIDCLAETLTEEQYDLVIGNICTIGDDSLHNYLRLKLADGEILHHNEIIQNYRNNWNMMAQNKLYNLSFIRQQHIFFKEGLIHEDELWSFEIACVATTLRAVQTNTYFYYIRNNSITSNSQKDIKKKMEAMKTIVSEMTHFLLSRSIFSVSAYSIIQKFIDDILRHEQKDRTSFRSTYQQLRQSAQFPLYYRLRAKKFKIEGIIQEIHYFLPPILGEYYKYWRLSK